MDRRTDAHHDSRSFFPCVWIILKISLERAVCVCVRVREREKYTDRVVSSLLFFCVLQVRWGHFSAAHHRSYMQADRAILTAITYVSLHVYSVSILIMNEAVAYTARLVRSKFAHDSLSLSLSLSPRSFFPSHPPDYYVHISFLFHSLPVWKNIVPRLEHRSNNAITAIDTIFSFDPCIFFFLLLLLQFSYSILFVVFPLSHAFSHMTLSLLLPECRRCWWRFYLTL